MKRLAFFLGLLTAVQALAFQAQAGGAVRATASAEVTILEPGAGVQASAPFDFVAAPDRTSAKAGLQELPTGNARLTIQGKAGDALSMSVPSTFDLVREDGGDVLTVQTKTTAAEGMGGQELTTGGGIMDGDFMKVDIGGKLIKTATLPKGAYQGLFVVLIQYN